VITSSYVPAIRYGGEYARLEELIVDDRARGSGAGTALLQAAIAEARRRGCSLVTLYSRETTRLLREGRFSLRRAGTASCDRPVGRNSQRVGAKRRPMTGSAYCADSIA
jgi:GNAT superfamily N-acetyltransferase